MEDCIFCKIANGVIPVPFVYEDDLVVAFNDAHPQAPVHILIVPRAHYASMNDAVPSEVFNALCAASPRVARAAAVSESGYRLVVNTGPDAGQTVHHLHVHLLGGVPMPEGMVRVG